MFQKEVRLRRRDLRRKSHFKPKEKPTGKRRPENGLQTNSVKSELTGMSHEKIEET
jgi:hypothetical protein